MSKGNPRIVVRLSAEELLFVQAAADTSSTDIKQLAKMGVLKEAMDIRNKLIEQLNAEHQKREEQREAAARASESSNPIQDGESQGVSGDSLEGLS